MIEKRKPGDKRIPSADWNAMADRLNAGAIGSREFGSPSIPNPVVVKIHNNTGEALKQWHVVGLGDAAIDYSTSPIEWRNELIVEAETPLVGTHDAKFGVVTGYVDVNGYGEAILFGATQVTLNVVSSGDTRASIKNSDRTQLTTNGTGPAVIVWKESGTGEKQGIVKLGEKPGIALGKTDGSISKGSSGAVSVYTGTAGSETDSGENVTAYNKFANVASGKWVLVAFANGAWYLSAAECP